MNESARVREIALAAIRGGSDPQLALEEILKTLDPPEQAGRLPARRDAPVSENRVLRNIMLGQVLDAGIEPFERFSSSAQALLREVDTIVDSAAPLSAEALRVCFRNLHTIKGNSRLLGLGELVAATHLAEQPYAELRGDAACAPERAELVAGLCSVRATIASYEKVYRLKVREVTRASGVRAEQALSELRGLLEAASDRAHAETLNSVQRVLRRAEAVPLDELVKESARMLPSLASELNRDAPVVECEGRGLLLTPGWAEVIRAVLAHAFRNALDHGLEPRDERIARGKRAAGCIHLRAECQGNDLRIRLADDGRGLWLSALRERIGSPDASDQRAADTVFEFGLSTAVRVSETSGRGVGMNAIREFVRQAGGEVRLSFTGEASGGCRPFELVLELPRCGGGGPVTERRLSRSAWGVHATKMFVLLARLVQIFAAGLQDRGRLAAYA